MQFSHLFWKNMINMPFNATIEWIAAAAPAKRGWGTRERCQSGGMKCFFGHKKRTMRRRWQRDDTKITKRPAHAIMRRITIKTWDSFFLFFFFGFVCGILYLGILEKETKTIFSLVIITWWWRREPVRLMCGETNLTFDFNRSRFFVASNTKKANENERFDAFVTNSRWIGFMMWSKTKRKEFSIYSN